MGDPPDNNRRRARRMRDEPSWIGRALGLRDIGSLITFVVIPLAVFIGARTAASGHERVQAQVLSVAEVEAGKITINDEETQLYRTVIRYRYPWRGAQREADRVYREQLVFASMLISREAENARLAAKYSPGTIVDAFIEPGSEEAYLEPMLPVSIFSLVMFCGFGLTLFTFMVATPMVMILGFLVVIGRAWQGGGVKGPVLIFGAVWLMSFLPTLLLIVIVLATTPEVLLILLGLATDRRLRRPSQRLGAMIGFVPLAFMMWWLYPVCRAAPLETGLPVLLAMLMVVRSGFLTIVPLAAESVGRAFAPPEPEEPLEPVEWVDDDAPHEPEMIDLYDED